MSVKTQPTISDDTSLRQFMQDVVVPKLTSLEDAVSALITKDALELALLKERDITVKLIKDAIDSSEQNTIKGHQGRVWLERAVMTGLIYLLGNNLIGFLSNIGRVAK